MNNKDIYDELRIMCGCMYISDLRRKKYSTLATQILEGESFTSYYANNVVEEAKTYVKSII